jgi:hypothetical protein
MERSNPVATLLDLNVPIEANIEDSDNIQSNPFAWLLGELQYLANAMQLDIAFAVNRLATFTANPSMKHYAMLKRIIRYLAGTKQFGITYRKMYRKLPIMGYANASHANQDEQKSILGILFIAARGAILWKSKKQMLSA